MATPAPTPAPGQTEAFEFRERLARGGMGEVWSALQVSLGRVVAVKVPVEIRSEDSSRLLQRLAMFRQEALVAAQLEHPNIVPVHERGCDSLGRPLLAMKLVQGRPWNELLAEDSKSLPFEEVLERHLPILVDMVQAVAFAHSKGIVHRDLKPSQVMVGAFGETLLMDWGLAVYVGDPANLDSSVRTDFPTRDSCSSPSGTPVMMAPEQTRLDAGAVDERTDVYLLGGTLYAILTDGYPHDTGSAREAFHHAREGLIEDPRKRAPNREMPEDLVALAMRALQADPAKRPQSALEFLSELRDYMTGASRRREAAAVATRLEARLREPMTDYAELGAALADVARARTLWPGSARLGALEAALLGRQARAALERDDLHLAEIHASRVADDATREPLLRSVRTRMEERARRESQRRRGAVAVVVLLALIAAGTTFSSFAIGRERDAADEARKHAETERERAESAERVAESRRKVVEEKSVLLKASRSEAENLSSFMITDLRGRLEELRRLDLLNEVAARMAQYYRSVPFGELDAGERLGMIYGMLELAGLMIDQSNTQDAVDITAYCTDLARQFHEESPGDPRAALALADSTSVAGRLALLQGKLADAEVWFGECMPIYRALEESHPSLPGLARTHANTLETLSDLHLKKGDRAEGRALTQEAIARWEAAAAANPEDIETSVALAVALCNGAARVVDELGTEKSLELTARGERILAGAVSAQPGNERFLSGHAKALRSVAVLKTKLEQLDGVEDILTRSIEITERLYQLHPTDSGLGQDLLQQLFAMGEFYAKSLRRDEAVAMNQRGVAIAESMAALDPSNAVSAHTAVVLRFQLARDLMGKYRYEEALALFEKNCAALDRLIEDEPGNQFLVKEYGANLYQLCTAQAPVRRFAECEKSMADFLEFNDALRRGDPEGIEYYDAEQGILSLQASILRAQGRHAEALAVEVQRQAVMDRMIAIAPGMEVWIRGKALGFLAIGMTQMMVGDFEAAAESARAMREFIPEGPVAESPNWKAMIARSMSIEGRALVAKGDTASGIPILTDGRDRLLALIPPDGDLTKSMGSFSLVELATAERALGGTPQEAWLAELDRRRFVDAPWR